MSLVVRERNTLKKLISNNSTGNTGFHPDIQIGAAILAKC